MLRKAKIIVRYGDVEIAVDPVDWGPARWTNRIIDLSPGAMEALGVKTDQHIVSVYMEM